MQVRIGTRGCLPVRTQHAVRHRSVRVIDAVSVLYFENEANLQTYNPGERAR